MIARTSARSTGGTQKQCRNVTWTLQEFLKPQENELPQEVAMTVRLDKQLNYRKALHITHCSHVEPI